MDFEWDDEKDLGNQQKHGLSFSEASRIIGARLASRREQGLYRAYMDQHT